MTDQPLPTLDRTAAMDATPEAATLEPAAPRALSPRQERIRGLFDAMAPLRDRWAERNNAFHEADRAYLRFLIPEGAAVLEIGCGVGDTLAALKPSRGVGIDLSPETIAVAKTRHPELELIAADAENPATIEAIKGPFSHILLSGTIGFLDDIEETLRLLRRVADPRTRIIVSYHSRVWEPILWAAEKLGMRMPQGQQNWLSTSDIVNLLDLAGWEPVRREWRQLIPKRLFGLGTLVNRYIAPLPGIRRLCVRNYVVARPQPTVEEVTVDGKPASVTVLIPCRNERGNIENAIRRLPRFAPDVEVIYVEGNSQDNTFDECLRVRDAYPDWDIKVMKQPGKGKGDAVRAGFAVARGDILIILDADLTVPPETMGKFYQAMVSGRGEFVNGTRLVYPMAPEAMRFLNFLANRAFARIFSFLLNQRFTDTLCGTKVLWRKDYETIVANRHYFGDFDPFGDFDLIFGAAKQNLKIVEVPVRYADRSYGETQISRFTHGWLLARMVVFAWKKLKAF
ncbi:glycosyltransferase [Azospirillum largimobile]